MHSVNKGFKLTEYSHGAGCGCKISPSVLSEIIGLSKANDAFAELIIGNDVSDDAAVMDIGDGTAIISTTDFFMPIVDDAFKFGEIASINAISDVYAMGGTPLLAIAILGWPINKIPASEAGKVLEGARAACSRANIPLAGGHSIDSPEPIFGLAVTGRVTLGSLKPNSGARVGDLLFLTKPLGIGILTTAEKKKKLKTQHDHLATDIMCRLNKIGQVLSSESKVHAMTDVTGFGLLGHLRELCEASGVSAELDLNVVPFIDRTILEEYLDLGCVPGGTHRNWESYGHLISTISKRARFLLSDPQTSGGLLIAAEPSSANTLREIADQENTLMQPIGKIIRPSDNLIVVKE